MQMNFKDFLVEAAKPPTPKKLTKADRRVALCKKYNKNNQSPINSTVKTSNITTFKKQVNKFVDNYPSFAKALYGKTIEEHYPKGIGPGEILCDFIFDDINLGGGSESVDLLKGSSPFAEVKAGRIIQAKNTLGDFKFGTDGANAYLELIDDLKKFVNYYNDQIDPDNPIKIEKYSEISGSTINMLRQLGDLGQIKSDFPKKGIPMTLKKSGDINVQSKNVTNIDKETLPADLKDVYNSAGGMVTIEEEISSFEKIEQKWKDSILKSEIGDKPFIFFDNKSQDGSVLLVTKLTNDNLFLERITANTAKPFIQL
jgi:hypothetical protein